MGFKVYLGLGFRYLHLETRHMVFASCFGTLARKQVSPEKVLQCFVLRQQPVLDWSCTGSTKSQLFPIPLN